ncbi:MAG: hypothetical protein ACYC5Q_10485 [Thermoleophilia bacterium]
MDREGSLHVLNDTARFYRYPDLTRVAEQLFAFIRDTIDREFTVALEYLTVFDAARRRLAEIARMEAVVAVVQWARTELAGDSAAGAGRGCGCDRAGRVVRQNRGVGRADRKP